MPAPSPVCRTASRGRDIRSSQRGRKSSRPFSFPDPMPDDPERRVAMQYLDNTTPSNAQRIDADRAVEPTGVRTLGALDVSDSMGWGAVAGIPGLTPREASAAIALATAMTEPWHQIVGFHAGPGGERFARAHNWLGGVRAPAPPASDPSEGLPR